MKKKIINFVFFFLFRLIMRTNRPLATQVTNLPDCLLTRGSNPKLIHEEKTYDPPKKKNY